MRYLADILTFSRFILSIVLFGLAFAGGSTESALVIFLVAELTDIFDGTCARKWPFPKNKTPKYRKYAAIYDMVADALLAAAQVLFLTLQVNLVVGLSIIAFYIIFCGTIELVVYGKLFGHPDNCTAHSLARRNFPLAKKIILTRRYLYAFCLSIATLFILFATSWPAVVKYSLLACGCFVGIFIWFFLAQRRKNISRDAVDIERSLTQKAHQAKKQK